jgi:hypothetical protein
MDDKLLGVYLNDHFAGSTAGLELIRRLAKAERGWAGGPALRRLAGEIEEDRATLLELMKTLDCAVSRYKPWLAWAGEKAARVKLNGYLLQRSPLSRVLELEAMMLGIGGKMAAWQTLRTCAKSDARLDEARLDGLITRAQRQSDELEHLRVQAAAEAFGGALDSPFERKPPSDVDQV